MANKKKTKDLPFMVKNDELKALLTQVKEEKSIATEQKMFAKLKDAKLLSPATFDQKLPKQGKLPNNVQVRLAIVQAKDGKSYFPLFTDIEEAKKMQFGDGSENQQFIVHSLRDMERLLSDEKSTISGIIVNPASAQILIPKNSVSLIIHNLQKQEGKTVEDFIKEGKIPPGLQVTFMEPSIYPTALVNAVYEKCRTLEGLSRVWFKGAQIGSGLGFAFIVEQDKKDPKQLSEIREAALPLAKELPVFVLEYTKDLQEKVIQDAFPMFDKELDL